MAPWHAVSRELGQLGTIGPKPALAGLHHILFMPALKQYTARYGGVVLMVAVHQLFAERSHLVPVSPK